MSERVQRDFRRQAAKVAHQTTAALSGPITTALQNEQLTRQRVESLEKRLGEVSLLLSRPFHGRLKWLLAGK